MNAELIARIEALAKCPEDGCGQPLKYFKGDSGSHFKCTGPKGHRWAPAPQVGDTSGELAVLFLVGAMKGSGNTLKDPNMRQLPLTAQRRAHTLAFQIEAKLRADPAARVAAWVSPLGTYLQQCETLLIQLMTGQQPPENAPGSIEFGLMLYLLDTNYLELAEFLGLPPTAITSAELEAWNAVLEGPGVVAFDGTLIGYNTYEQLDPGWLLAVIDYLGVLYEVISTAPFATSPRTWSPAGDTVTIAVTGDWGTGSWQDGSLTYPAAAVGQVIQKLQPDLAIHLGDVYYAGTKGEERSNLVGTWVGGSQGSYTLNSNHEMYDGANGYFKVALAGGGPFALQQGTSYFAIDGGSWIIIGLDSAYYSQSFFCMQGTLTDSNQLGFIGSLDTKGKTVIIMTHHNGLAVDGSSQEPLWAQVCAALGRPPDFWYWGHVHNGIVYSSQSAAGTTTQARCVGHGGLPFGSAYALQRGGNPIAAVTYFAHEPLSSQYSGTDANQANRVLNGFALLTLSQTSIQEDFYNQAGKVVWSSTTTIG